MKKVIYSAVMYPCDEFDIFIMDYLKSIFIQTNQNFELLLVLDNISIEKEDIESSISYLNLSKFNPKSKINISNKNIKIKLKPLFIKKNLFYIQFSK